MQVKKISQEKCLKLNLREQKNWSVQLEEFCENQSHGQELLERKLENSRKWFLKRDCVF